MKCVCLVLSVVYGFAWKSGVIVIAVALLAAMTPGRGDDGAPDSNETYSKQHVVFADGEPVRVTMKALDGGGHSSCLLLDEDGRLLLQTTYDWHGALNIRWGDAFPAPPSCTATRDGRLSLGARQGMMLYNLMINPNGACGLRTQDYSRAEYRGLGYSQDGQLVVDPWAIGSAGNQVAAARSGETTTACPSSNSSPAASLATEVVPASSSVSKLESP